MPLDAAQIERSNNLVVATFSARQLTITQMQEVVVELMEMMRNDNVQFFVLDMAAVEFISSGCLGSLVGFLQDLEHVRGRVAMARCKESVAFLFKVTRLDSVFNLYDDLQDACEQITRR